MELLTDKLEYGYICATQVSEVYLPFCFEGIIF